MRGHVCGTGTEHTGVALRQRLAQGTNGLQASIGRRNGGGSRRKRAKGTRLRYGNRVYGKCVTAAVSSGRERPSASTGQRNGSRSSCNKAKGRTGAGMRLRYGNRAYGSGVTSAASSGHERPSGFHQTAERSALRPKQKEEAHRQGTKDARRCEDMFAVWKQSIRESRITSAAFSERERPSGIHRTKRRSAFKLQQNEGGTPTRDEGYRPARERVCGTGSEHTGVALQRPSDILRPTERSALRLQQSEGGAPREQGCAPERGAFAVWKQSIREGAFHWRPPPGANGLPESIGRRNKARSRRKRAKRGERLSGIHRTAKRSARRLQQSE